jgi:hypothetical protein
MSGQFKFDNEDDFKAWILANAGIFKGITAAPTTPPDQGQDAAHGRRIVEEQRQEVLHPPSEPPRLTPGRNIFSQDDKTATNAVRLVVGRQAPRSSVNNYGINQYLPDFTIAHIMMHHMMMMLLDCKRFFDQSSFFHPLLGHVYLGVIAPVHIFRCMRDANTLPAHLEIWLERFERRWPAISLPVPGPLVTIFQSLAVSKVGIDGFDRVTPFLPGTPRSHNNSFGVAFHANMNTPDALSARIAPVPALLDQYARFLTAVRTGGAAGGLMTADEIMSYASFGHTICGTPALNAVPANADVGAQTPVAAGLNPTRTNVFNSPGFTHPPYLSLPIATNIRNTSARVVNVFPAARAASNAAHTWDTFFGLDHQEGQWFTILSELMILFGKHFSGSISLAEISEVGHTAGQISFVHAGALQPAALTRFPATDVVCSGSIRSPVVSDSDLFDACVGFTNRDLRVTGVADNNNERQTGPFWNNVPVTEDVVEVHPLNGLQSVIRNSYFIAAPRS